MLRFLLLVSVCLSTLFMLVIAVLSREWGWSEYASDALYMVFQTGQDYYVIEVDDTPDDEERLVWGDERMTAIDCSPDGHAFAFLTDAGHVVTVMSDGTVEEVLENEIYPKVSVANNGSVALFNPETGVLRTNTTMNLSERRRTQDYDTVDLSSQGFALWSQYLNGILIFSPNSGEHALFLPHAIAGKWLASEEIFSFLYTTSSWQAIGVDSGLYIADVNSGKVVRVGDAAIAYPFSPDGIRVAAGMSVDGLRQGEQIIVFNPWIDFMRHQLTTNLDESHWPLCFLTFRPEMLIDQSS